MDLGMLKGISLKSVTQWGVFCSVLRPDGSIVLCLAIVYIDCPLGLLSQYT